MSELILGIDIGTTSLKAAVFDHAGAQKAAAVVEYSLLTPQTNIVEAPCNIYMESIQKCMQVIASKGTISTRDITVVGFSVQGETLCLLDGDCQPLKNAIVWMDNRAGEQAEELRSKFGDELCYQVTGQVSFEACWPAAKLLWVRENEPELFSKVRHILLYCPVHDTTAMMDQITRVVLLTMSVIAAAAIALFWLVAGSISVPVQRLCEAARGIGEKKFKRVETGATVKELCELEGEINHMQEKLAQADQAERTFFQNASHELRTPLMSISGYAQGIQCGVFEDVAQAASVILDESTRLTEVVDGILTLTRMDQLRYQVVPVELAVNGFIEERLECLEGFAYSKNIKLVFQPGEEHKIITDAMLLERAFSNVMSNCIRYAGTQVAVAVREKEGDILITVTDDGPGFPEGGTEHLFDRFYKGKGGNHGLGLAIARCSLEYMGGSVRAADTQKGAEFEITLPQDCRSFAPDERTEM